MSQVFFITANSTDRKHKYTQVPHMVETERRVMDAGMIEGDERNGSRTNRVTHFTRDKLVESLEKKGMPMERTASLLDYESRDKTFVMQTRDSHNQ